MSTQRAIRERSESTQSIKIRVNTVGVFKYCVLFVGQMFSKLNSGGGVYMKNSSFTEGMVVINVDGKYFNLLFDSVNINTMTINLTKVENPTVVDSNTIRLDT